jgi:hypothetical protein
MKTITKISILTATLAVVMMAGTACKKDPKRDILSGKIEVKFVTPASRSVTNQSEEISALYFNGLNIVAYQNSPGYGSDGYPFMSYESSGNGDWAHYVVMNEYSVLDDTTYAWGANDPRDIVMLNGGVVDIQAMNRTPYVLNDYYKSRYDDFRVDFLEISTYLPGIFFNNVFYGEFLEYPYPEYLAAKKAHLLTKYPQLGDFSIYKWITSIGTEIKFRPVLEGMDDLSGNEFSVLFARSDWFPEPVLVGLTLDEDNVDEWGANKMKFYSSSKPLSSFQKETLLSLINDTRFIGGVRRGYTYAVVPYSGPVKLALYEDSEGLKNPEFKVSFDFTNILTAETYNTIVNGGAFIYTGGVWGIPGTVFTFAAKNSIPFGISASVGEKE